MTELKPNTAKVLTTAEELLVAAETEKTADVWAALKAARRALQETVEEDYGDEWGQQEELKQIGTILGQVKNAIAEVDKVLSGQMPVAQPETAVGQRIIRKRKIVKPTSGEHFRRLLDDVLSQISETERRERNINERKNAIANLLEVLAGGKREHFEEYIQHKKYAEVEGLFQTVEAAVGYQQEAIQYLEDQDFDEWKAFVFRIQAEQRRKSWESNKRN